MFEIAPNRYIVAKRIVSANVYQKDNVIKIAIEMDTVNAEARTQYSAPMADMQQAQNFVNKISSLM